MFDQDVIIVGGGPAGLSAGAALAKAGHKILLLEKEDFGGYLKKVERFHGHPDYPDGVSGPELAEQLITKADASGLTMEFGEVEELESYTSCRSITCTDGKNYTAMAVILAGGRQALEINVPGETEFLHKGVIHCVLCDAGLYHGKTVAVCGGGNTGVIDALMLARHADRVIVIEREPGLTAMEKLTTIAGENQKLEFLYGCTIDRIVGTNIVEALEVRNIAGGNISRMEVDGVVIDIGYRPDTDYLEGMIPLDDSGRIAVNNVNLQTELEGVFAIGDIRTGTALNLVGAIQDGEKAAAVIREYLV